MFLRTALLSAILLASLPLVMAGGTLDAGVLVVQVEDQRHDCTLPVAGFCAFDYSHDGNPGNLVVDTYQEIRYVGIAIDLPLLPDQSVTLRGNDLYVPNPVTPAATETWNDVKPEDYPGSDHVWIVLTPEQSAIYYHGPWVRDPTGPWGAHGFGVSYVDGEAYDQFGPYNAPSNATSGETDNLPAGIPLFCTVSQVRDPCLELTQFVVATWKDKTPNVKEGYQFWEVQVATDPDELAPPSREGSSDTKYEYRLAGSVPDLSIHGRHEPSLVQPLDKGPSRPQHAPSLPSRAAPAPLPPTPSQGEVAPQDDSFLTIAVAVSAATVVFLLITLYSRLLRRRIFANRTRKRVYELIQARPGIGIVQLATELNVNANTIEHHVALLKTHDFVTERKPGKARCYFVVAAAPEDAQLRAEAVLRDPARRHVAELVLRGAKTTRLLVAQSGLGRRLIAYHLARLEDKDLVISDGVKPKQYRPSEKLRQLLSAAPHG